MPFQADAGSVRDQEVPLAKFQTGRDGCRLIVPVTLGERNIPFLVDTGAAKTSFDVSLEAELGPATGNISLRTSAGFVVINQKGSPICLSSRPQTIMQ